MTEPRKPEETVEKVGEEQQPAAERKPSPKTMQELERLQFDALDRAGGGR